MITYRQFLDTLRSVRSKGHTPFLHEHRVFICTTRPGTFRGVPIGIPTLEDVNSYAFKMTRQRRTSYSDMEIEFSAAGFTRSASFKAEIRGTILKALGLKETLSPRGRKRIW